MIAFKEHYIVDEKGNRVGVLLNLGDYRKLLAELEELESIRAYDAAKASGDEAIPFERAVAEIERDRKLSRAIDGLYRLHSATDIATKKR